MFAAGTRWQTLCINPVRMSNGIDNSGTRLRVAKEERVKKSGQFRKYASLVGILLVACVALLMFAGCSKNTAGPDEQTPPDGKLSYLYDTGRADDVQTGPSPLEITEATVSEVVGLLGGTIEVVVDGAQTNFTVPAGAVVRPVNISLEVTKYDTPLGALYIYDCGPDGTKFKTPAKLSQPMPAGQEYAFLYYFNEETGRWELQEFVKVKDGVATFSIKHFSKYGVS